jgi:GxxExxY protein
LHAQHRVVTEAIIGSAIAVHKALGPALLESVYQAAMGIEFEERGIAFRQQVQIPATYRNRVLGHYRIDFIVERAVVLELKSVARFESVFDAQMLTYLQITGLGVGLLINFNTKLVADGIRRYAYGS